MSATYPRRFQSGRRAWANRSESPSNTAAALMKRNNELICWFEPSDHPEKRALNERGVDKKNWTDDKGEEDDKSELRNEKMELKKLLQLRRAHMSMDGRINHKNSFMENRKVQ